MVTHTTSNTVHLTVDRLDSTNYAPRGPDLLCRNLERSLPLDRCSRVTDATGGHLSPDYSRRVLVTSQILESGVKKERSGFAIN